MVVDRWSFERNMAMRDSRDYFDHLVRMSLNDSGKQRVDQWLKSTELEDKVFVGVVGVLDQITNRRYAHAVAIFPGKGHFMHEECYDSFPSEHFKTKILLVTGGA